MNGREAHLRRRQEDVAKLNELATEFPGVLTVANTTGNPITTVEIDLNLRTAKNAAFPRESQSTTRIQILLPTRYPFEAPVVHVRTPIYNPNIFPNGQVCLGKKWIPTENLALFARRLMQIIALDPAVIDVNSPANGEAARWYKAVLAASPTTFPTVALSSMRRGSAQKRIVWKSIT